jgi:hypothetical protein
MKVNALSLLMNSSIVAFGWAPAAQSNALTDEDVAAIRETHAEYYEVGRTGDGT